MAHNEPGCTAVNAVQTSMLVNSTDCSFKTNLNEDCVVKDPDPSAYGAAFAAAGGGVFIIEFAKTGISCVFLFCRYIKICSQPGPSTCVPLSVFGSFQCVHSTTLPSFPID